MIKQIGEEITILKDYKIELAFSGDKLQVKEGDKGFIDSKGSIHYITGKARGKIHRLGNIEVDGYDCENIAKMLFRRIKNEFNLGEYFEDYEISEREVIESLEDVLSDIL